MKRTSLQKICKTIPFATQNPKVALSIGYGKYSQPSSLSNIAYRTSRVGGVLNGTDDRGSELGAYRHVLWQDLISCKHSPEIAKTAGDLHENGPYNDDGNYKFSNLDLADEVTDQLNNRLSQDYVSKNGCVVSIKDTALDLLGLFHDEGFFQAHKNPDETFFVERTKLPLEKYQKMRNLLQSKDEQWFKYGENSIFWFQKKINYEP